MKKPSTQPLLKAAAVTATLALTDDIRRGLRTIRRHLSRRPGPRFRTAHGDPATWGDNEYETYFAITADQPRRNIHPAA